MSIYDFYCFKNESFCNIKTNIRENILLVKYFNFVYKNYGKKEFMKSIKVDKVKTIKLLIVNLAMFDEEVQNWIIKNIIGVLSKDSLIKLYMEHLCNTLFFDKKYTILSMESFIKSGLIKDIKLKEKTFSLITLDDKSIKFKPSLRTLEEKDLYNGQCHNIVYSFFNNDDVSEFDVITILESTLYGYTRYHSFLYSDGYVFDLARNVVMKYSDYEKLFEYDLLVHENGYSVMDNIRRLEESNKSFANFKKCKILKYAIHKQINS